MNARDLPGPGDSATWGHLAASLKDWRRMERARLFIVSLMNSLIEGAR